MSLKKLGSIEVEIIELDSDINRYTRKEREKYIAELFKNEYQGKEIKYLLTDKEIDALINRTTRRNFFATQHNGHISEKMSEYKMRQDIAFSGNFLSLVSNADYVRSSHDQKIGQNKNHTEDTVWHHYNKYIQCQNAIYQVTIAVREQNDKYYIHNIKIKEIYGSTKSLTSEKNRCSISNEILPNNSKKVKREMKSKTVGDRIKEAKEKAVNQTKNDNSISKDVQQR